LLGGLLIFLSFLQEEHDEIEEQYLKEKAELEAKYQTKYAPLYEKVRRFDGIPVLNCIGQDFRS
jgi:hypothetical protein